MREKEIEVERCIEKENGVLGSENDMYVEVQNDSQRLFGSDPYSRRNVLGSRFFQETFDIMNQNQSLISFGWLAGFLFSKCYFIKKNHTSNALKTFCELRPT